MAYCGTKSYDYPMNRISVVDEQDHTTLWEKVHSDSDDDTFSLITQVK